MRRVALLLALALPVGAACTNDANDAAATGGVPDSPSFCAAVQRIGTLRATPGVGLALDNSMSEREMSARVSSAEAELRAQVADGNAALDALDAAAPTSLRDDVATITDADRRYLTAFANDPFDVDAMFAIARESKRLADVEARIDAHSQAECGTPFRRFASGLDMAANEPATPTAPTAPTAPPAP